MYLSVSRELFDSTSIMNSILGKISCSEKMSSLSLFKRTFQLQKLQQIVTIFIEKVASFLRQMMTITQCFQFDLFHRLLILP